MADDDHHECPTCGRDDFVSGQGVKIHHAHTHGESLGKKTIVCDQCGEKETLPESLAERKRFCSRDCYDTWQRTNGENEGEDHHNWSREEIVCEQCGERALVKQSLAGDRRFCSKECCTEWQREKGYISGENHPAWKGGDVEVGCANCGSTKTVKRAEVEHHDRHFCTPECQAKWQSKNWNGESSPSYNSVTVSCTNCGADKNTPQSRVKRNEHHFCDTACRNEWLGIHMSGEDNPNWEGGGPWHYGPNWYEKSRKRRVRDQARCQMCGMTESEHQSDRGRKLTVHHIRPAREFREGGEFDHESANRLSNLMTVCDYCHPRAERMSPLRPEVASD